MRAQLIKDSAVVPKIVRFSLFLLFLVSNLQAQNLKVGCLSSNAPFSELVAKILIENGFQVEIVILPAERSWIEFKSNTLDAEFFRTASTIKYNPLALMIDVPLFQTEYRAYTRDSSIQIRQLSDLAPHTIGYALGTKSVERLLVGYTTIPIPGNPNLAEMLALKRIDVFVTNQFVALYLQSHNTNIRMIPQNPPLLVERAYFVLNKNKAQYANRIKNIFQEWVDSGRWQKEAQKILQGSIQENQQKTP